MKKSAISFDPLVKTSAVFDPANYRIVTFNPLIVWRFSWNMLLAWVLWSLAFYLKSLTVDGLESFVPAAQNHRHIWQIVFLTFYSLPALWFTWAKSVPSLKSFLYGTRQDYVFNFAAQTINHYVQHQKHSVDYRRLAKVEVVKSNKLFHTQSLILTLELSPDSPLFRAYPDGLKFGMPNVKQAYYEAIVITSEAEKVSHKIDLKQMDNILKRASAKETPTSGRTIPGTNIPLEHSKYVSIQVN